jgi:hypothetical protein
MNCRRFVLLTGGGVLRAWKGSPTLTTLMQAVLYGAGLGDVIRSIYLTRSYQFISETTVPVKVLCASHNPYALEIFRYHRNARNFVLHDLGHKYEEFLNAGLRGAEINRALCDFAGVLPSDLVSGRHDGYVPVFDALDDISSTGHVVFQPYTGSVSSRVLPETLLQSIVQALRESSCRVFIVTRSYPRKGTRGQTIHAEEDAQRFAGGNITVLEHLTVPATLNLIKTCAAYVGSWSSLQQAAWFEHKPVAVFYPPQWCDVGKRTDYAFGLDRENTWHSGWDAADMDSFASWLRTSSGTQAL